MKTTIPEELKKDIPQTQWGKILTATPVVMTVVATLLAGLASSEMTRAQYDRSLGAQLQSKAGDQWNYFQAKKLRGAMQRNSLELLKATAEIRPLDFAALEKLAGVNRAAFEALERIVNSASAAPPPGAEIQTAIQAVAESKPEAEVAALLKGVDDSALAAALETARENVRKFDEQISAAAPALDDAEKKLAAEDRALSRDFIAARMAQTASRYETEARLNQTLAQLFELQVRKANLSAERHRQRSGKFFFGMLAAQAAVIIATFAIAARQRNLLWTLAACSGLAAVAFAIYVYLRV